MKTKNFQPNEIIIAEGTFGDQTFRILSGKVLIYKEAGNSQRIPIAVLGPDEVFGEMYLMDHAGFRSATAIAKTEVTVQVLTREELQQAMESTPDIIQSILNTMSKRLEQTSQECARLKYQKNTYPLQRLLHRIIGKKPH